MLEPDKLEAKIGELLDDFYARRLAKISDLKLKDALKRKNPYLYRAIGTQQASDIVSGLLTAYMSSSDEGIFGDAFFEPLAIYVSGGAVSPSEGVDVAVETEDVYTAIAVKSGPSVFNAQSKKKQLQDFRTLRNRLQKLNKRFDPLIGYCYGNKQQRKTDSAECRELAGQAFWWNITGEPDFYLKIIRLMKDKPQKHLPEFQNAWGAAVNKFTKEFVEEFCYDDGSINWDKLTEFNSGIPRRMRKK